MFGKKRLMKKRERKGKKDVDSGAWGVVIYSSAQERGPSGGGAEGRKNLENDTERRGKTTVNSEMSFFL